jgi:methyl-accepting chemotaxis protein
MTPKLIGSFVLVAILAALVGGVGLLGMSTMNTQMSNLTGNYVPSLNRLRQVDADISAAMSSSRSTVLSTSASDSMTQANSATTARNDALNDFQAYLALPSSGAQKADLAANIRAELTAWADLDAQVGRLGSENTKVSNA